MKFQRIIISVLMLTFLMISLACQTSPKETANTNIETPTPEEKINDFEKRLKAVQDANFDYIYAFRRKDGGEFDKEDKTFVKQNAHFNTNQWVLTQDEKVVIAGSNYMFSADNLDKLKSRFNVEDYSKPIETVDVDVNTPVSNSKNTNVNNNGKKNANKSEKVKE